jgi:hypothetical protein
MHGQELGSMKFGWHLIVQGKVWVLEMTMCDFEWVNGLFAKENS